MRLHRELPRKARMEIVPLIDVIFLVLASFVYASSSMSVHRGIRVDLPRASSAQVEKKEHTTVSVTAAGEVYLDKVPIPLEDLREALAGRIAIDPDLDLRINGDEGAPHGTVVKVLDAARLAGIRSLAIESRPGGGR